MGGVYFLLKLRDSKPSEHASKINIRDIIIYTVLAPWSKSLSVARGHPGGPVGLCLHGAPPRGRRLLVRQRCSGLESGGEMQAISPLTTS